MVLNVHYPDISSEILTVVAEPGDYGRFLLESTLAAGDQEEATTSNLFLPGGTLLESSGIPTLATVAANLYSF